jgi:hypothetical protein
LQLCKISGCLYTPYVQDNQIFGFIIDRPIDALFKHCTFQRSYWVPSDTGHRRFEASSRSARLQGLLEVGPARFLAAMLGDLGVSSLCSIKTMTQFSSLLSIKPAMLPTSILGDYSTSTSSTPFCFYRRIDLLGNPFLITSLLDLLSSSLLFWTIIPTILPAMMLGYYS